RLEPARDEARNRRRDPRLRIAGLNVRFESGRQDLNLRPPGPQPQRNGCSEFGSLILSHSQCVRVALSCARFGPQTVPAEAVTNNVRAECSPLAVLPSRPTRQIHAASSRWASRKRCRSPRSVRLATVTEHPKAASASASAIEVGLG